MRFGGLVLVGGFWCFVCVVGFDLWFMGDLGFDAIVVVLWVLWILGFDD